MGLSNCEISDLSFFVVLSLYRHICKSTLAPVHEIEIRAPVCDPTKAAGETGNVA